MQRVSLPSRQPNQSLSLIRRGRRKERNEVFAALTKTAETECSEFLLTTPGCSAAGSARGLGPRCRRFESCHSDQNGKSPLMGAFAIFCDRIRMCNRNRQWRLHLTVRTLSDSFISFLRLTQAEKKCMRILSRYARYCVRYEHPYHNDKSPLRGFCHFL